MTEPTGTGELVKRLRGQIAGDEERGKQGHPDPDYGAHNEARPESLIMCVLDHGPLGEEVFTELCSCGYSIVPTATLAQLADALEAAEEKGQAALDDFNRLSKVAAQDFAALVKAREALEAAERTRAEERAHATKALKLAQEMQDKERERTLDAVIQAFEKGRDDVLARLDNPDEALWNAFIRAEDEYDQQGPNEQKTKFAFVLRALARTLEGKENSDG